MVNPTVLSQKTVLPNTQHELDKVATQLNNSQEDTEVQNTERDN
jgi:hypothetical protein